MDQRDAIEAVIPPAGLRASYVSPQPGHGVVIFAQGSGKVEASPRNARLAEALRREAGLGTLMFDILRPEEMTEPRAVFDIALLADRLALATAWLRSPAIGHAGPIGYLAGSTGTAAALVAAAAAGPEMVRAIVSRSGRPDLAGPDVLGQVRTPTLLIVGGQDDPDLLALSHAACALLKSEAEVRVVEGADHLFEAPGTLDQVARLATDWFSDRLQQGRSRPAPS